MGGRERGPSLGVLARGGSGCCGAKAESGTFSPMADPEYETYRLTATYYTLRDGLAATLMLNNKGPEPVLATPTFYSLAGTRLQLAPITVPATSYIDVDMHQLLSGAAEEFREGSMKIAYSGIMTQLGAQVKLVDAGRKLIWAEQFVYTTKFTSSRLEGVWWLPFDDSKTRVVVSNTSGSPITASITVDGTAPQQSSPADIMLAPWETRVLDIISDIVGASNGHLKSQGGISIDHTGSPGAVLARMFVAKPNKGYSAATAFHDPGTTASQRWHGNGFRFRNLNGAKVYPIIAVRNTGEQPSRVKGRIIYTRPNGNIETINLPERTIPSFSTKAFELEPLIANASVPSSVQYGGIEIEYDTSPGSVLTSIQSVSQNGEHVFQVPMFDPASMPSSAGGFPWKADGDFKTLVYIKNETATVHKFTADLYIPDGGSYGTGLKEIRPGETIAIDFRAIREAQTPDRHGTVIPLDLERGQIAWSVKGADNKVLSARSEQISVSEGVASTYSCANCCPDSYYDGLLIPYEASEEVGGITPFRGMQQDSTCLQTLGTPYEVTVDWWESNDLDVAEVVNSAGDTEAVGTGTAYITAGWSALVWSQVEVGNPCNSEPVPAGGEGPIEVTCPTQLTQYPNAYPTNLRVVAGYPTTPGNGELRFHYTWDSSDGNVDHLYACQIRECVTYGNTTCDQTPVDFLIPSPPYKADLSHPDPTILPSPTNPLSAAWPPFIDRHKVPGVAENQAPEFRTPYVAASYTGTQKYQYRCPCKNQNAWTDLLTNISIVRVVSEVNSVWTYKITKSGSSATYPLP